MTVTLTTEDANDDADDPAFDRWIDELREDVVQDEFGYEPGEFTVYPELWRGLYDEGLSPLKAFERALAAHKGEA